MQDKTDDELMHLIGSGDRDAFGQLVQRHLQRAFRIAMRVVDDGNDAEDIVQEALLRVWRKAPDWCDQDAAGGARFTTWFYRVLMNLCLDRNRRQRPLPLDKTEEQPDPAPDGLAQTLDAERARRVTAVIKTLPERQRAALSLCYFEELSNRDAAAILEVSVGAIESLLVRARRNLASALADLIKSD